MNNNLVQPMLIGLALLLGLSSGAFNAPPPRDTFFHQPIPLRGEHFPNRPEPMNKRPADPQIGLNFIRFFWSAHEEGLNTAIPYLQPKTLFADFRELLPYKQVEAISSDGRGLNVYKITTNAGAVRYVAWGKGVFKVPPGVTKMVAVVPTAVVPGGEGYIWQAVQPGQDIPLTRDPLLFE